MIVKKELQQILFYLGVLICLSGCTSYFFQPLKQHIVSPDDYKINYQDIYFKSIDDLNLHGWWFPADGDSKAVIVFLHGNYGNISVHANAAYWLTQYKYDVFIFDYRGYGKSEGIPLLHGALSDIERAIGFAVEKKPKNKKIFVIGQSLGASMGIYAISQTKEKIDGAIFLSPFSDYREISREVLSKYWLTWALQWPLSFTIDNDYRPLDYVSVISPVPTLFLYSDADEVIPSSQTRALFEATEQPKAIEELVGLHNTILDIQLNRDVIVKYLDRWIK